MMIAILDFTHDSLLGLNVRPYNYLDPQAIADMEAERDDEYEYERSFRRSTLIPFVVTLFDSDEGELFNASFHRTRKDAEISMAYHDDMCPTQRGFIQEQVWVDDWELNYTPMD